MSALNALRNASTPEGARRAIDAAEKLPLSDYERGLLAGALVEASARCSRYSDGSWSWPN